MDTLCSLTLPLHDTHKMDEAVGICRAEMDRLEALLSKFREESDVSKINACADKEPVRISSDTEIVIKQALHYANLTEGAFNPLIAPLMEIWGFTRAPESFSVPDDDSIKSAVALTDYSSVKINDGVISFMMSGIKLDLGGIAKGYAVDVIYEKLTTGICSNFLLNVGGNIRCAGAPEPDRQWSVGVRDPYNKASFLGKLNLSNGLAVATSGNYERFRVHEGRKHAHIIDPRSGYPVEGMAGVTVVAPSAAQADALSTALFVLGIKKGSELIEDMPNCAAIFVEDSAPTSLYVTGALSSIFLRK